MARLSEAERQSRAEFKIGDRLRVYCGPYQDHCFTVKGVRWNQQAGEYEYLYDGIVMGGWYLERCVVPANSRLGWHYDSQGYCDNPGRGY